MIIVLTLIYHLTYTTCTCKGLTSIKLFNPHYYEKYTLILSDEEIESGWLCNLPKETQLVSM